ncbi:MAG: ATP-binding protein [Candidatus Bipolaricaulota bacterium]|nr:ATP-binding protein [Candidatus Bipolaricaulota bacterium]
MQRMEPAFKVGGRIEPPYFMGREVILRVLVHDAASLSQSNVVIAPRRFGKTALLRAIESETSNRMLAVYVNCLGLLGPAGFHDRVVEATLSAYEERHGKAQRLLATWRKLLKRPILAMRDALEEIGGSFEGIGTVRLKLRTREIEEEALPRAALSFLEVFAKENDETVLLILDEFQALAARLQDLVPLLKEKMDSQRRVTYLFSGSSLGLLHEVFGDEANSPLYQMVGRQYLGEIETETVQKFLRDRLRETHDVTISSKALDVATDCVGGIPYYVQKLGIELERQILLEERRRIGGDDVRKAFSYLIEELGLDFQERWAGRYTEQQRRILKTLAATPGGLTDVARQMGVPPENLSYNLNRLQSAMILAREGLIYRHVDHVFAAWLQAL